MWVWSEWTDWLIDLFTWVGNSRRNTKSTRTLFEWAVGQVAMHAVHTSHNAQVLHGSPKVHRLILCFSVEIFHFEMTSQLFFDRHLFLSFSWFFLFFFLFRFFLIIFLSFFWFGETTTKNICFFLFHKTRSDSSISRSQKLFLFKMWCGWIWVWMTTQNRISRWTSV